MKQLDQNSWAEHLSHNSVQKNAVHYIAVQCSAVQCSLIDTIMLTSPPTPQTQQKTSFTI